jgi:hypothetical protein
MIRLEFDCNMHLRETNTWQIHATQNQKQKEHNTTQQGLANQGCCSCYNG